MKNKSICNVDVLCQFEGWSTALSNLNALAADLCVAVLADVDFASYVDSCEISILFTDDDVIQDLNARFRNKNKATNVLSFPSYDINPYDFSDVKNNIKGNEPLILGDVILAYETISKEAERQNKSLENHVKHLIIHSVLHLLGYDHIDDCEAKKMERTEIETLKKMGIDNPYFISENEVN